MTTRDYGVLWSVQDLMETQVQEVEEVGGRGLRRHLCLACFGPEVQSSGVRFR